MKLDTKQMDAFMKALAKGMPEIKVGILGDGAPREGEVTNAFIGACHEFGTSRVPMRSFLRIPLADHFGKKVKQAGYVGVIQNIVEQESLVPLARKFAVMAEAIVLEGFATGGYGKWKAHAEGYQNNTGMLLQDTQQLRNSITSEVQG